LAGSPPISSQSRGTQVSAVLAMPCAAIIA
jgi:hypothetical protein